MIDDVEQVMAAAKASGDARLIVLASRELRPAIDAFAKMEERAHGADEVAQRRWLEFLAQLPDDFVERLRDNDDTAFLAVQRALGPQDTNDTTKISGDEVDAA